VENDPALADSDLRWSSCDTEGHRPPYQYSKLAIHNLKKGVLILDIIITALALIFSVIDRTHAV
jgi:hypothetical protein